MSLHQSIRDNVKTAMTDRDKTRVSVLRGLLSELTNELVSQKKKPQDELSDEDVLKVVQRQIKQHKDSIEQYEKGGRPELAEQEKAELEILEEFMPEQMSDDEIREVVKKKKEELGITEPSQMGQLMGAVMPEVKGKADGDAVKKVVQEELTG